MGKQKQTAKGKRNSGAAQARPGMRRVLDRLLRSGKIAALVVAALSGWIIYDALKSPRYRVRVVEATGTQALTSDDVAVLANVQDQPIWYIEPAEVVQRVQQSPYIQHAEARLILPDRLEVAVTERKPEVQWMHQGTAYAVTWDGLVVDLAGPTQPLSGTTAISATDPLSATMPLTDAVAAPEAAAPPAEAEVAEGFVSLVTIVDTTPNRPLKVGDHVDADALELARRVMLRAPSELPAPITRIEWDAGLGVSLIVGEGRQVVLGKSDELDRKMATLRYLLADNTPFSYLDLRPSTPYYR